jgi:hypothetical protein
MPRKRRPVPMLFLPSLCKPPASDAMGGVEFIPPERHEIVDCDEDSRGLCGDL